jgi:hypothetical protein
MEEQIKMAKLNAEYNKKQSDIKARKQANEVAKHTKLNRVDELYHHKKRQYLDQIAATRMKKEGLTLDDPKRADLTDAIRNIEDELNILKDWRDIEARRIVGEMFAEMTQLEEEGRRLDEWLDEEKIKVMEEQHAAKLAREAAEAEKGGEQ